MPSSQIAKGFNSEKLSMGVGWEQWEQSGRKANQRIEHGSVLYLGKFRIYHFDVLLAGFFLFPLIILCHALCRDVVISDLRGPLHQRA